MVAAAAVGLAQLAGATTGHSSAAALLTPIDIGRLLITLAVAAGLSLLGRASRLPAGVFLFPMVGGAALQAMGMVRLELPTSVLATHSQADLMQTAPRQTCEPIGH